MWILYVAVVIVALPVVLDALCAFRRLRLPNDTDGDESRGLVIFAESIRWLGVRWGLRETAVGLRRAGFTGRFLYWKWHSEWRAWLVLPAIMDSGLLERRARRLAAFIVAQRRRHPDRPIYLMGYSCGGFVAVRALEQLPDDVAVDGMVTLAGAFSPWRDLSAARAHVRGEFVVSSSWLDWLIVGLGTLVFGTGDRKHVPSAGMCGTARPASADIRQIRWTPTTIRTGNVGGHFSASAAGYIADIIAPAMGLATAPQLRRS